MGYSPWHCKTVGHDLVSKPAYSHPGGPGAGSDGISIQWLDELLRGWENWWRGSYLTC